MGVQATLLADTTLTVTDTFSLNIEYHARTIRIRYILFQDYSIIMLSVESITFGFLKNPEYVSF